MIEHKQGHHHKRTNSQPMKRDLNVDKAVRNGCVQQHDISLSATLNMALPRRLIPVSVMISMNEGYVSPQNQRLSNYFGSII